ncbi:uncharacterized protein METZ01_LOCUS479648, partial [marine metagenome]
YLRRNPPRILRRTDYRENAENV